MENECVTRSSRFKKQLTNIEKNQEVNANDPASKQLNYYCLVNIFQYLPIYDRVRIERG